METRTHLIKKRAADILELPRDIMLDLPKVTLIGGYQLCIENHKGIIEYSTDLVRINTKAGILIAAGKGLIIKSIVIGEIIIMGRICRVEFLP